MNFENELSYFEDAFCYWKEIKNIAFEKDRVIDGITKVNIFGVASIMEQLADYFDERQIEILGFYSIYDDSIGGRIQNKVIKPINEMPIEHKDVPLFLASPKNNNFDEGIWLKRLNLSYSFKNFTSKQERQVEVQPQLSACREKILEVSKMFSDAGSELIFQSLIKSYIYQDSGYAIPSLDMHYWHPVVSAKEGDIIIDAGAFTGDTALNFVQRLNGFAKIIAMEPSPETYEKLLSTIAENKLEAVVIPLKKGAWSEERTCYFSHYDSVPGGSQITNGGELSIEVIDIDSVVRELKLPRVDLIKYDVEGAEIEALKGAIGVIAKYQPKLMVSLYHRPTDLWEIPLIVKNIVPDYDFYLGHHTTGITETVLYGVPRC